LNEEERRVFGFLRQYSDLIGELRLLCDITDKILQRLKQKGLSFQTVDESLSEITRLQESSNKRLISVGNELSDYLRGEKDKLPNEATVWHCSSDIIESLFGYYKFHKSPNKMNGITQQIFLLPLKAYMCSQNREKKVNIKKFLEQNTLAKINQWKNSHLLKNQYLKRINSLKKIHSNS
jgi:hypothetical protein